MIRKGFAQELKEGRREGQDQSWSKGRGRLVRKGKEQMTRKERPLPPVSF